MGRPKKKVILFVVEGRSDQADLERPIKALLEDNEQGIEAEFLVAETDITSDFRNTPDNILQKINRFYFEPFFSANDFYYPKDILEVVQIVDLDGAYVPDDYCFQFTVKHWSEDGFVYDPPNIYGATKEDVINRNHRKSANIDYLLTQSSIKVKTKTIPYSMYFFSLNIDHYLHHKLNLSPREKVNMAESYADRYCEDPHAFCRSIWEDDGSTMDMSHSESWTFIKEGVHSAERYSNLGLYLKDLAIQIGYE